MAITKISLYFMGTDAFASVILKRLAKDLSFEMKGVVTPSDRLVGRKQTVEACPVKVLATSLNVPIFHEPEIVVGQSYDFLVVASYGQILSREILESPRVAALNVHGSLLPMYRGASPIQAALLNGDRVTGISLQRMVSKLDAGPVYSFSEVAIRPDHDASLLREEMAILGAEMVAQSLPGILDGSIEALEQDEKMVSYSPKIDRESGKIDWANETAIQILNKLKAYTPWPGVFTTFKEKRLKILSGHVAEGNGSPGLVFEGAVYAKKGCLFLDRIQLEGKNDVSMNDFVRGNPDFNGAILGL